MNESMVERFWPDEDPIGKRFRDRADDPWITVVGVVADVRHQGLGVDPEPKVYRPYPQDRRDPETWLLRTSGPPGGILAATKDAVRSVSSGTAVNRAVALDDLIDRGVAVPRMRTALVIAMAALGSFLAMLGLYGVVSYSVSQKRREIGVRMALGARAAGVVRGVVASGLFLAGTGVVIGALVAAQATSLLTGFLYAVEPLHAPTFVAAGLLVGGVSALAALLPARRAAAVDPVEVLSGD